MAIDNIARITPTGVENWDNWENVPEDVKLEIEIALFQKGVI
jgi:hypothetical protein